MSYVFSVTEQDRENEKLILERVGMKWPILIHKRFVPTVEKGDTFDFAGQNAFLDVKVRDIASYAFPTVILSGAKGDAVLNNPDIDYYMIYFYTTDRRVRIFHLNNCNLILNENYKYFHKRKEIWDVKRVYEVHKNDAIIEIAGIDIGL